MSGELSGHNLTLSPMGETVQLQYEQFAGDNLIYANALLDSFGTVNAQDSLLPMRAYTWEDSRGYTLTLQRYELPDVPTEPQVIFSASHPEAPQGEYAIRAELTPTTFRTQSPYVENTTFGETDLQRLHALHMELWGQSSKFEYSRPLSEDLRRRLSIASDMYEYGMNGHLVVTALGRDSAGNDLEVFSRKATADEIHDTLYGLTVATKDGEQHYRITPEGNLHRHPHDPLRESDERLELDATINRLYARLETIMEHGQQWPQLRYRVACIMDKARTEHDGAGLVIFNAEDIDLDGDRVNIRMHELKDRYVVDLHIKDPAIQQPYLRRLLVPKDKRKGLEELSLGHENPDFYTLFMTVLDRALDPPPQITRFEPNPQNVHEQTLDGVIQRFRPNIPIVVQRSEGDEPFRTREEFDLRGQDGDIYRIVRMGRLGLDGVVTVQSNIYKDGKGYDLTPLGPVPKDAEWNGPTPHIRLGQRRNARRVAAGFLQALEFVSAPPARSRFAGDAYK